MSTSASASANERKVAFASKVKMRISLHVSDYSLEEMQASFYDYLDIEDFKDDAKAIARMSRENGKANDQLCIRGVEHMLTGDEQRKRKERRRSAVSVVLKEQFWCDEDPSKIADAYRIAVKDCAQEAYQIGLADQEFAKSINDNTVLPKSKTQKRHRLEERRSVTTTKPTATADDESSTSTASMSSSSFSTDDNDDIVSPSPSERRNRMIKIFPKTSALLRRTFNNKNTTTATTTRQ